MAIDLLGQLKHLSDGDVVRALGVKLDEQPDHIEQALALGGPAILAALTSALENPDTAGRIVDAFRDEAGRADLATGLGGLVRDGSLDSIVDHGRTLLRTILGDRLGRVTHLIAEGSGARQSSVSTLLGLLVPAILGLISRALGDIGPSPDALRDLLAGQREAVARQAPGGLAEALGLHGPAAPVRTPTNVGRAAPSVRPAASTGRAAPRSGRPRPEPQPVTPIAHWAAPAALGFLVLLGAYYLLPREAPHVEAPSPATVENRPIVETAARFVSIPLPGGLAIEAPEGSSVAAMAQALHNGEITGSQTFAAADLTFHADDKLAAEAAPSIGRIARLAAAYPNLKLKVNGRDHARRRAEAVREALVGAGLAADRVAVEVVAGRPEADAPISISLVVE